MDVMEAIAAAKAYVVRVYADADLAESELEERGGQEWRITLSFTRPRAPAKASADSGARVFKSIADLQNGGWKKLHKVVVIDPAGEVVAMKDRAWLESAG